MRASTKSRSCHVATDGPRRRTACPHAREARTSGNVYHSTPLRACQSRYMMAPVFGSQCRLAEGCVSSCCGRMHRNPCPTRVVGTPSTDAHRSATSGTLKQHAQPLTSLHELLDSRGASKGICFYLHTFLRVFRNEGERRRSRRRRARGAWGNARRSALRGGTSSSARAQAHEHAPGLRG